MFYLLLSLQLGLNNKKTFPVIYSCIIKTYLNGRNIARLHKSNHLLLLIIFICTKTTKNSPVLIINCNCTPGKTYALTRLSLKLGNSFSTDVNTLYLDNERIYHALLYYYKITSLTTRLHHLQQYFRSRYKHHV